MTDGATQIMSCVWNKRNTHSNNSFRERRNRQRRILNLENNRDNISSFRIHVHGSVTCQFNHRKGFNSIQLLLQYWIHLCCLFFLLIPGEYSCLRVDLTFKREFSYYLIQIYIPCCMLVIVSWVSFWLDPNAIPARVSLGVTTLLTMATQISGINASLPPVSYTKAIDVWYVNFILLAISIISL